MIYIEYYTKTWLSKPNYDQYSMFVSGQIANHDLHTIQWDIF